MKLYPINFAAPMVQVALTSLALFALTIFVIAFAAQLTLIAAIVCAAIIATFIAAVTFFSKNIVDYKYKHRLLNSNSAEVINAKTLVEQVKEKAGFLKDETISVNVYKDVDTNTFIGRKPEFNAFATGVRKNHRAVYISLSLYKLLENDPKAMQAVIAHELQHINRSHLVWGSLIKILSTVSSFISETAVNTLNYNNRYSNTDKRQQEGAVVLYGVSKIIEVFGVSHASRMMEFDADEKATRMGLGNDLARALLKLNTAAINANFDRSFAVNSLSDAECEQFLDIELNQNAHLSALEEVFKTHPKLKSRIGRIQFVQEQMANEGVNSATDFISKSWNISKWDSIAGFGANNHWRNDYINRKQILDKGAAATVA